VLTTRFAFVRARVDLLGPGAEPLQALEVPQEVRLERRAVRLPRILGLVRLPSTALTPTISEVRARATLRARVDLPTVESQIPKTNA
jgi:hypothetical protein